MACFRSKKGFVAALAAFLSIGIASNAEALTLKEAVAIALKSNPEIMQASRNREAVEFELRQSKGLFLPTVDLEASTGGRRLDSPSRRRLGTADDDLYSNEVSLSVTQTLIDGGGRRAAVDRQASRVDSASFRVLERSQATALAVTQEYLEYLLQAEIIREIRRNISFHQSIIRDIRDSITGGALTDADLLQGQERLQAANAALVQASEDLEAANTRFRRLVGQPLGDIDRPASVSRTLPPSLERAISVALLNNPLILLTAADVDAADAQVREAKSSFFPVISLQGRANAGDGVDGSEGSTTDLDARVVARWNLYRGGADVARMEEQIRRASEQREVRRGAHREVEESVRLAWDRRIQEASLAGVLAQQADSNGRLVTSYREQLAIGQRSLLDVLDAQNTRFNVNIQSKTAQYASLFSEYRILAATGQLLNTLSLAAPEQSETYARDEFAVPVATELGYTSDTPSRQANDIPLDLLSPIRVE